MESQKVEMPSDSVFPYCICTTVAEKALRGLLRTASRVLRSRGPLRALPAQAFPRFSSGEAAS